MKTQRIPIRQLTEIQIIALYSLMDNYYSGITLESFKKDLHDKDEVILLLHPHLEIVGFSTLQKIMIEVNSKKVLALFSGDTVLKKEFWGNGALGLAFGRYLMKTKLRHPFTPTYWFLISKGYKTYLLMANNFPFHFPRHEKKTPKNIQEILDAFYIKRFPLDYNSASGLIRFPHENGALKVDVAGIDQEKLLKHPRIQFFSEKNPNWQKGVELACLARVDISIPLRYVLKRLKKLLIAN